MVCLKLIKTETFCNLLNFLYLSRILKMMVQMHLACYTGGIFLYDIRAHTCVPCCHNQPKVGNDFFELISSSDAEEKEFSSKSKIVFL